MNVLHLTNELNYSDGVASHLFYLLKNLKHKSNCTAFLMYGGGNGIEKFKDTGFEAILNKNIHHGTRTIKHFAAAIQHVYKFAKEKKIDIVHSHNHYASNIADKASKLGGFKTVQTVHGLIPQTGRLKHYCADHFIAVNDHVFEHLLEKKIPNNRIDLIYNGIDFDTNVFPKTAPKIKIISASRLEKGKGIETLIKAVSQLPKEYRDKAEFFIAGSGSLENSLSQLNQELNAGIKFTGEVKEMKERLKETHIFIISSESEGLPMTLLEAAAAKNLIISSDFKGVDNILTDGLNGLIFEMNNADDLASKIKFSIDNFTETQQLAESFFNKAKEKFSAVEMAESHYNLYKNILCGAEINSVE